MKKPWALALCLGGCVGFAVFAGAQVSNSTVVFNEAGFPAADSADGSSVASLLVGVQTANAEQLPRALQAANTHLLLLPCGSAFQRQSGLIFSSICNEAGTCWSSAGGHSRAPHIATAADGISATTACVCAGAHDRPIPDNAGIRRDDIPEESGPTGPDFGFAWKNAFSPIIRLSAVDLYH
jgi:hypothetical protein